MTAARVRLWQLLDLVAREDHHLGAVRDRLFAAAGPDPLGAADLARLLANPAGIDRLESFVGKFARMQDTLMDKLLPALLRAAGEPVGSVIDNLNRLAALGLVDDPSGWLANRALRNRLVHEYVDDLATLAEALGAARATVASLHDTYRRIRAYCEARPALARPAPDSGACDDGPVLVRPVPDSGACDAGPVRVRPVPDSGACDAGPVLVRPVPDNGACDAGPVLVRPVPDSGAEA